MFDLESICLIGGVFVISAGTLFIIDYLFKNKSYEEAVAEQRQQNSALYNSQRPKPKEKKQKKNNKKVKEKKSSKDKETDSFDDSENQTSDAGEPNKHHHVEFSEVTVIEEVAKEACSAKRKQKKEVVRPILVNRDSSSENIQTNVEPVSPANHFEELHPKDEFELLNSHKDDSPKESPKGKGKKQNMENEPPKQQKSEMPKNKKSSKSQANEGKKAVDVVDKPIAAEPVVEAPVVVTGSSALSANPPPAPPPKDKKKKKSEISTLQQLAGDKSQEVNISILMPLVRNAEMSRDEVQILIDMLLNKQQDAPVADEWSEGKADPVQKMKRQLAEKEKLVVELEESLTGSQNKLREIRAEFNAEKSLLQQNAREHLENFNKCNAERQAIDNKSQTLSLQCKHISEEHSKLMDQFSNLQLKNQQLEVHLAQKQEAELNQLQLLEQKLKDDLAERERRIAELLHINKDLEMNLELELQNKDKSRQIADEAMCMKQQLEVIHQQKEDEIKSYKSDMMRLKNEQVALSEENNQLKKEIANLQSESSKFAERISSIEKTKTNLLEEASQWHQENAKLQEDNANLLSDKEALLYQNSSEAEEILKLAKEIEEIKGLKLKLETDISKLNAENQKLHADIAVLIEDKKALEAKSTGTLETNEKQIVELQAELADANLNFQTMKEQLHKQLEEQINKNNDLRQKNWKVMEALNAAESRTKAQERQYIIKMDRMIKQTRIEEQDLYRYFIRDLFPELDLPTGLAQGKWEELIERAMKELRAAAGPDNSDHLAKVTSKVLDYKKIVDETEGMLSKLHNHIEDEEIRWRMELMNKDEQIERLEAEVQLLKQVESELDVSLDQSIEVKIVPTKSQNHSNPTNGPTPSAISHDQTLSTASSATSSVTEESVKKNKKKKKKNNGK